MANRKQELSERKTCPTCKRILTQKHFYVSKRKNGNWRLSGYCRDCANSVNLIRRQKLKKQAVLYKGGKCEDCGYIGYEGVFDFHHLDPTQKDMDISHARSRNFDVVIQRELDKCVLLCSNCHRIRHAIEGGFYVVSLPGLEPGSSD